MMMDPTQYHFQQENLVVIPGQLIAVSREGEEESSFLRGHGTYIDDDESGNGIVGETKLRASVTGTVQRVNKLISVLPLAVHRYDGHVGDLVVGRIVSVGLNRWKVQLVPHQPSAILPLSGVHLPGGVQRMRTQQDAREMRQYLTEGDLVSAEVHKTLNDGASLQLHTRSTRYGKLENGCWIQVPPGRIPKRKQHYISNCIHGQFDILLGCNGWIWMQRAATNKSSTKKLQQEQQQQQDSAGTEMAMGKDDEGASETALGGPELVELQEAQRAQHAALPYSNQERQALARLRNAVEFLRLGGCIPITLEAIEQVFHYSLQHQWAPTALLHPKNVVTLTNTLINK